MKLPSPHVRSITAGPLTRYSRRASRAMASIGMSAVLLLDFLALDDITTGLGEGFGLEYLMLLISLPALAVLARVAIREY